MLLLAASCLVPPGDLGSAPLSPSCERWQAHLEGCEQAWDDVYGEQCETDLTHVHEQCGADAMDAYDTARVELFDCLDAAGVCEGEAPTDASTACYAAFEQATVDLAVCLSPPDSGVDSGDSGGLTCQPPRTIAYAAPQATSTPLDLADDGTHAIELGFTATFLDVTTDVVHIGANGVVSLGAPQDGCCFGEDVREREQLIAVAWTDLDPSSGGAVAYDLTGDQLVVTWTEVPQCCEDHLEPVTASLILGPDALEVHTLSLTTETAATQGIVGVEQAVCDEARQATPLDLTEDAWAWP